MGVQTLGASLPKTQNIGINLDGTPLSTPLIPTQDPGATGRGWLCCLARAWGQGGGAKVVAWWGTDLVA